MEEFVKAIVSILEYLILGGAAFGFVFVLLTQDRWNLRAAREFVSDLIFKKPAKDGPAEQSSKSENPSARDDPDKSNGRNKSEIRTAFVVCLILAGMFYTGVFVNSVSYWMLQPAHWYVIDKSREPYKRVWPPCSFFVRLAIYPWRVDDHEYKAYRVTVQGQLAWQYHAEKFYDATFLSLDKQARLIRGSIVVIPVSVILAWCCFFCRKKDQWKWKLLLKRLGACLCCHVVLMLCYWSEENSYHLQVWRLAYSPIMNTTNAPNEWLVAWSNQVYSLPPVER